ncbi:hypothetical protein Ciccas_013592 [Cichlidogyrus casuarinus]|uniref:Uridylate-specific endoribonuclease n=1 Tax=Cichlidogyrus casuarinus TaxID=1844966 RepID=A0ABD2PKX9_9PLAT
MWRDYVFSLWALFVISRATVEGADKDTELSKIFEELWALDENRAEPNTDWRVNVQGSLNGKAENLDVATSSFFTFVNEKKLTLPTYTAFIRLLDNYDKEVGSNEKETDEEKKEIANFIDAISKTKVMKKAHEYLVSKGLADKSMANFMTQLSNLWFSFYNRNSQSDSSGFEHVFVGETKRGEILGLHNWIQFYLEEKAGRLDYAGYHKSSCYKEPRLFTIGLKWTGGNSKHYSSILVGPSPEFEMAMYTVAFLTSKNKFGRGNWNDLPVQVGPCFMRIQCYDMLSSGLIYFFMF